MIGKNQQQISTHLYKIKQFVKRITIEGEHNCLFLLKHDQTVGQPQNLSIEIIPVMNAPYQVQHIHIPLNQIKIVHVYRYMFQYKAIRIVTTSLSSPPEEYIFDFQKKKHADKVMEVLQGG